MKKIDQDLKTFEEVFIRRLMEGEITGRLHQNDPGDFDMENVFEGSKKLKEFSKYINEERLLK